MPFNRTCKNNTLNIPAVQRQRIRAHRVVNALDALFDDWPFIQIARYIMGGGTNQFYTSRVRLVIGLSTLETGQKAMVDIDSTSR